MASGGGSDGDADDNEVGADDVADGGKRKRARGKQPPQGKRQAEKKAARGAASEASGGG